MRAFVIGRVAVAPNFPTDMVSMHAALPRFDICPARSNIVLHANRLIVVLSILVGASIRNLNLALSWSAFPI